MLQIKYELVENRKAKPDWNNLGFGRYFTDHMFIMDYHDGQGWHDARIVPYQNLSLDPACMVFHYAQEMFEVLKFVDCRVFVDHPVSSLNSVLFCKYTV